MGRQIKEVDLSGSALLAEAVAAVDGTVAARLERKIGLLAAGGAGGHEDFTGSLAEAAGAGRAVTGRTAFAGGPEPARGAGPAAAVVVPHPRDLAADHAPLGLIPESELRVMFLLLGGEDEIFVAVLALQRLVCEWHDPPG